ncbi:MAG: HAD-IIIA family hydrolase [Puniceicoccales bacterium]|jgi:D-glycero-D-manno-heptose 1,7-bisphosphate phosphatase|nr:HAD-IIIA family hydrolase [Puniceicoccales bacterium]
MAGDKVAVFLDRDGTIIVDKNYIKSPDEVELLPSAREAIGMLRDFGCLLFLFSNQSGVARRLVTVGDVAACNGRMIELLGDRGEVFDEICMAYEEPSANPIWRKPSPKFIVTMVEKYNLFSKNCYMVGDKESDAMAGINAGINAVLIRKNSLVPALIDCEIAKNIAIFPSILEFSKRLTLGT